MPRTEVAVEKIACPRKCGAKFCRQPHKSATVIHSCPNTMRGTKYKRNQRDEIEVRVGGPNAGQEVRE